MVRRPLGVLFAFATLIGALASESQAAPAPPGFVGAWTMEIGYRNYSQTHADFYSDLFERRDQQNFMARDKDVIEEAFPGDVVGLFDTGNFKIGDTLTEGEAFYFT